MQTTLFQVFLIEIVGRRTLMLYGVGGMAIFYTILTSMFCFEVFYYDAIIPSPNCVQF